MVSKFLERAEARPSSTYSVRFKGHAANPWMAISCPLTPEAEHGPCSPGGLAEGLAGWNGPSRHLWSFPMHMVTVLERTPNHSTYLEP